MKPSARSQESWALPLERRLGSSGSTSGALSPLELSVWAVPAESYLPAFQKQVEALESISDR